MLCSDWLYVDDVLIQIDPETQEPIPLVIAGGGGGQGLTKAADPINADGGSSNGGDGGGGYIADNGAGRWSRF